MIRRTDSAPEPIIVNCRKPDGPVVRVYCYLRISTNKNEQELSLESQLEGVQIYMERHRNWVLTNVYADEGVTGTSARKRKEFMRMIRDAENGGCDKVLVKSISRYSRNTLDSLQYIRRLRELGIGFCFIKENIDTTDASGEMMLTVFSAFAQQESLSISENVKWGIRKRYEMGEIRWCQLYGYRRNDEKETIIYEPEAEVVRHIFSQYRKGVSIPEIIKELNDSHILSPHGKLWTSTTVKDLLRNERYIGNTWQQKWIVPDHLTHKAVLNDESAYPRYSVQNSHTALIDKKTFNQVQRIMELKAPRGECSRYPYEDTAIICPFCGRRMITRLMQTNGQRKVICCFDADGCQRFSVKTWMLDECLHLAFAQIDIHDVKGKGEAAQGMRELKESGIPDRIEYYFLAETVKTITFHPYPTTRVQNHKKRPSTVESAYDWDVIIDWKCGLSSLVPLPHDKRYTEEPTYLAERYRRYLHRITSGEYCPAKAKSIYDRKILEGRRVIRFDLCHQPAQEVTI